MTENAKKFLAQVSQDTELAEKLRSANVEQVIALGKELGFNLTEDDFAQPEGEVSEEELDAVSGGKTCACLVNGGGSKSLSDNICACVWGGYGSGEFDSGETFLRCACVVTGGGE